ncbi:MAG: VOC family protein, partial [Pseudomonadota bacterium]
VYMIIGLDHIAIAVNNLPKEIQRWITDFQFDLQSQESVAAERTDVAFLPIEKTHIELVSPMQNDSNPIPSALQKSIEKRGQGLHHLCFRSSDLNDDMQRLKNRGYVFLSDKPTQGAHGRRIAWLHPKYTSGLLIEIVEVHD